MAVEPGPGMSATVGMLEGVRPCHPLPDRSEETGRFEKKTETKTH
jgi:hypothetical protein